MHVRSAQRGLSLLEFTLVTLIVSVLIVFAFQRVAELRTHMERAAVRQTVEAIRSALALRLAELVVQGRAQRALEYEGSNALDLLSPGPVQAAARARDEKLPPPGSWYFESDTGLVAYRPRWSDASTPTDVLRWRVEAARAERDGAAVTALTLSRIGEAQP